jgi:hypothetical protein
MQRFYRITNIPLSNSLFVANAFNSLANKPKMLINLIIQNSIVMISLKPYTLAVFEPESSVLVADPMSFAPRRQDIVALSMKASDPEPVSSNESLDLKASEN